MLQTDKRITMNWNPSSDEYQAASTRAKRTQEISVEMRHLLEKILETTDEDSLDPQYQNRAKFLLSKTA